MYWLLTELPFSEKDSGIENDHGNADILVEGRYMIGQLFKSDQSKGQLMCSGR
jgi:hypothetical protein